MRRKNSVLVILSSVLHMRMLCALGSVIVPRATLEHGNPPKSGVIPQLSSRRPQSGPRSMMPGKT